MELENQIHDMYSKYKTSIKYIWAKNREVRK